MQGKQQVKQPWSSQRKQDRIIRKCWVANELTCRNFMGLYVITVRPIKKLITKKIIKLTAYLAVLGLLGLELTVAWIVAAVVETRGPCRGIAMEGRRVNHMLWSHSCLLDEEQGWEMVSLMCCGELWSFEEWISVYIHMWLSTEAKESQMLLSWSWLIDFAFWAHRINHYKRNNGTDELIFRKYYVYDLQDCILDMLENLQIFKPD